MGGAHFQYVNNQCAKFEYKGMNSLGVTDYTNQRPPTHFGWKKNSKSKNRKLEDLKVLRRSPDLFNNVKIGQSFTAYNKTYFVIPYMGVAAILVK